MKTLSFTPDGYFPKVAITVSSSRTAAISLPNLIAHGDHFTAESPKFAPELLNGLIAHGLDPQPVQYEESGLTGVLVRADGSYEGGADPRREGVALSY